LITAERDHQVNIICLASFLNLGIIGFEEGSVTGRTSTECADSITAAISTGEMKASRNRKHMWGNQRDVNAWSRSRCCRIGHVQLNERAVLAVQVTLLA